MPKPLSGFEIARFVCTLLKPQYLSFRQEIAPFPNRLMYFAYMTVRERGVDEVSSQIVRF